MKKIFLSFITIVLLSTSVFSQTTDQKWAIFVGTHATDFTSKFGLFDGYFDVNDWNIVPPLSKITVARSLNSLFVADLTASVGEVSTKDAGNPASQQLLINDEFFLNIGAGLRLKLLANGYIAEENSFFDPYLRAGLAFQSFNYNATIDPLTASNGSDIGGSNNLSTQLGAGFNVWITDNLGLQVASDFNWIPDSAGTERLNFFQHSVGVGFRFGKPSDKDSDGLVDKKDDCPEVAGPVENMGCPWPDTDGDTVLDKDDECVEEAGPVENMGCPLPLDTDSDGVIDDEDLCPVEPGLPENDGCPVVEVDTDGDTLSDINDICPNEYGPADNGGCPNLTQTIKDLEGVLFKTGSAEITEDSQISLNNAAITLINNPDTYWVIEGHTDSSGSVALNNSLSKKRAESVKKYLTNNGVEANRLNAKGYGSSVPVRPNSTETGRSMNRRVEFKFTNENFDVKALKLTDENAAIEMNRQATRIYFEVGSAVLKMETATKESLQVVSEYIKNSNSSWEIGGHTDSTGRDEVNNKLSLDRAKAVVKYLIEKGVPAEKLKAVGYGSSMPVDDNTTIDGRANNRRIEFTIVK